MSIDLYPRALDFAKSSPANSPIAEIVKPLQQIGRYRLATNASFKDKFNHFIFRLVNAVKAIFGKSDWQLARKELIEWSFKQTERLTSEFNAELLDDEPAFQPFKHLTKDEVAVLVDAGLALLIEQNLNTSKIIAVAKSQIQVIVEKEFGFNKAATTSIGKVAEFVAKELVDDLVAREAAKKTKAEKKAQKANKEEIYFEKMSHKVPEAPKAPPITEDEMTNLMPEAFKCAQNFKANNENAFDQGKGFSDGKVMAKIASYSKELFKALKKEGQIQQGTVNSLNKTVDLLIQVVKKNPELEKGCNMAVLDIFKSMTHGMPL